MLNVEIESERHDTEDSAGGYTVRLRVQCAAGCSAEDRDKIKAWLDETARRVMARFVPPSFG